MGIQLDRLEELYNRYVEDPAFSSIRKKTSTFVPGSGPLNPNLMLIGEAPGYAENTQGKPFVGKAGTELKYLLKGADIDPYNVFLTSIVKYFSPTPQRTDKLTQASFSYLLDEIDIVNPIIVGLCGLSVINMFYPDITELVPYNGKLLDEKFVPLYNPAVMLHTPHRRTTVRKGYESLKELINV